MSDLNSLNSLVDSIFAQPDYAELIRKVEFQEPVFAGITPNFIMDEVKTRELISQTINVISTVLSRTLGPHGTTTIIRDGATLRHQTTKDGYSVLKKLVFKEAVPNTVLDLVKRVSFRLVTTVGDGSTTAVVTANYFYQEISNIINKFPPQELLNAIKLIGEAIEKTADETNLVLDASNPAAMERVALISTNNDREISGLIKQAYELGGMDVKLNMSSRNTRMSYINHENMMKVDRGLISPFMQNVASESFIIGELQNPKVIMIHGELDSVEDVQFIQELIGYFIIEKNEPLVIVANNWSSNVLGALRKIMIQYKDREGGFPFMAIDHSDASKLSFEKFRDLAAYLGCHIIDKAAGQDLPLTEEFGDKWSYFIDQYVGNCEEFKAKGFESKFINGLGSLDGINERIAGIRENIAELHDIEDQFERTDRVNEMEARIANITQGVVTIFIGGDSKQEIETRGFLVEDAIKACESARKHGIVRGSSLFIPTIINLYANEILDYVIENNNTILNKNDIDGIMDCMVTAYESVFAKLVEPVQKFIPKNLFLDLISDPAKVYNVRTLAMENVKDSNIFNSLETEIEIMRGVFSIVGILVSSNQFVSAA